MSTLEEKEKVKEEQESTLDNEKVEKEAEEPKEVEKTLAEEKPKVEEKEQPTTEESKGEEKSIEDIDAIIDSKIEEKLGKLNTLIENKINESIDFAMRNAKREEAKPEVVSRLDRLTAMYEE